MRVNRLFVSDELYLHIIYGITFDFDNGLIRIDWEHKTEDCIVSPDNQDPKTMTMDTISNFQLECDWIGCSHRETNKVKNILNQRDHFKSYLKPFRTPSRKYDLINLNDARTKIHR